MEAKNRGQVRIFCTAGQATMVPLPYTNNQSPASALDDNPLNASYIP